MLTRITATDFALGCTRHLFTITSKDKLEWAACYIKQVAPCRGLLIIPGMMMVEFPGMYSASHLLPMITLTIKPSLLLRKVWDFLRGLFLPICIPGEVCMPDV